MSKDIKVTDYKIVISNVAKSVVLSEGLSVHCQVNKNYRKFIDKELPSKLHEMILSQYPELDDKTVKWLMESVLNRGEVEIDTSRLNTIVDTWTIELNSGVVEIFNDKEELLKYLDTNRLCIHSSSNQVVSLDLSREGGKYTHTMAVINEVIYRFRLTQPLKYNLIGGNNNGN